MSSAKKVKPSCHSRSGLWGRDLNEDESEAVMQNEFDELFGVKTKTNEEYLAEYRELFKERLAAREKHEQEAAEQEKPSPARFDELRTVVEVQETRQKLKASAKARFAEHAEALKTTAMNSGAIIGGERINFFPFDNSTTGDVASAALRGLAGTQRVIIKYPFATQAVKAYPNGIADQRGKYPLWFLAHSNARLLWASLRVIAKSSWVYFAHAMRRNPQVALDLLKRKVVKRNIPTNAGWSDHLLILNKNGQVRNVSSNLRTAWIWAEILQHIHVLKELPYLHWSEDGKSVLLTREYPGPTSHTDDCVWSILLSLNVATEGGDHTHTFRWGDPWISRRLFES